MYLKTTSFGSNENKLPSFVHAHAMTVSALLTAIWTPFEVCTADSAAELIRDGWKWWTRAFRYILHVLNCSQNNIFFWDWWWRRVSGDDDCNKLLLLLLLLILLLLVVDTLLLLLLLWSFEKEDGEGGDGGDEGVVVGDADACLNRCLDAHTGRLADDRTNGLSIASVMQGINGCCWGDRDSDSDNDSDLAAVEGDGDEEEEEVVDTLLLLWLLLLLKLDSPTEDEGFKSFVDVILLLSQNREFCEWIEVDVEGEGWGVKSERIRAISRGVMKLAYTSIFHGEREQNRSSISTSSFNCRLTWTFFRFSISKMMIEAISSSLISLQPVKSNRSLETLAFTSPSSSLSHLLRFPRSISVSLFVLYSCRIWSLRI